MGLGLAAISESGLLLELKQAKLKWLSETGPVLAACCCHMPSTANLG